MDALALVSTRLDLTLSAIADAFQIAAEKGSAAALDHLAEYMNGCDAVEDQDILAYEIWAAKGKP